MAVGSFRESLDLSHIASKYEALQESKEAVNYVNYVEGRIRDDPNRSEPIPKRLFEQAPRLGSGPLPELVGNGPRRASTCLSVALWQPQRPAFAWDPRRYYRDLGVPFPFVNATRGDLMRAFYEVQPNGPEDRWLTYCLKQLLDTDVRARYDALKQGEKWLDDDYVQDEFKAEIAEEARQRALKGDFISAADLLDEKGYMLEPDDSPEDDLDGDRLKRQDDSPVGTEWQYAFYVWRSQTWDKARLAQWQSELVSAVAGGVPAITVGMMGNQPHRFAIAEAGEDLVVFLNRDVEITPDLVEAAAAALIAH